MADRAAPLADLEGMISDAAFAGATLRTVPFLAQVGIRLDPAGPAAPRVAAALGLELPEANHVAESGGRRALWLGAGGTLRGWTRLGLPLVLLADLAAGHDDRPWLDAPPLDLAALPGFEVLHAASPRDLPALLAAALRAGDRPVLVAHGFDAAGDAPPALAGDGTAPGARIFGDGGDVAILALGRGVAIARAAVERLAARGVGATLVDLVRAQPLDGEVLHALARDHRALLVLEDPAMAAGIGAGAQRALGGADAGRLGVLRAGRRASRELVDAALALLGARAGGGMASGGRDADPGGQ